jgi:hypothetical protein
LAETTDEPHLQQLRTLAQRPSGSADTNANANTSDSKQYQKSAQAKVSGTGKSDYEHKGLRKSGDHLIQDIKELMALPVIITADVTKSPPVLVVYACEYLPQSWDNVEQAFSDVDGIKLICRQPLRIATDKDDVAESEVASNTKETEDVETRERKEDEA